MSEEIPAVYYILNTMSNRVYVGQSKRVHQRIRDHRADLNQQRHHSKELQRDWNDFGQYNFEFGILVEVSTTHPWMEIDRLLRDHEQTFIRVYQSDHSIYGYNIPPRGRPQKVPSE